MPEPTTDIVAAVLGKEKAAEIVARRKPHASSILKCACGHSVPVPGNLRGYMAECPKCKQLVKIGESNGTD